MKFNSKKTKIMILSKNYKTDGRFMENVLDTTWQTAGNIHMRLNVGL